MKDNKFTKVLLYININKFIKIKTIIIFQYFLIIYLIYLIIKLRKKNYSFNDKNIYNSFNEYKDHNHFKLNEKELDYLNNKFAIIRINCRTCALFSYYNRFLRCMHVFIKQGYIPIIDLLSFPNILNNYNISSLKINPWELYFNQPYGYTLENVKRKAKTIKYYYCDSRLYEFPNKYNIIFNKALMDFWHNIAYSYVPIKNEILKEANIIMKNLFKGSNNILGVLVRGTDYISIKPKGHPIQPELSQIFNDIKKMNKKNSYDWIFLATEDDIIKKKFIFNFGDKLKYLNNINKIDYNYKQKNFLVYNRNIKFDYNFFKLYLLNIIIMSKCIDIICSCTNGTIGVFIFTEGFRNNKIYWFGLY